MSGEKNLKLYSVTYNTWNMYFSDLIPNDMLAVGTDPEDAIERTKEMVEKDARDFQAKEITNVMGFQIVTLSEEMSNSLQSQEDASVQTDTPQTMLLTLKTSEQSYPLVLPASEERLDHAKRALGIDEFSQAVIDSAEYIPYFLKRLIPTDGITVEDANELALCLQEIKAESETMKYCAVLEVEQPSTFSEALNIAMDRDDYEIIPEDMDEYGKQVLRRTGADDEIIDTVDGYMDFARLGKDSLEEDGVRRTEFGLVRRLSTPFPEQSEMGQQML